MMKYMTILEGRSYIIVSIQIGVRWTEWITWLFPNYLVVIIDKYAYNEEYLFYGSILRYMVVACFIW